MMSETFEQALLAAEADGALNPAWKKFVHTRFFVPVVPAQDGSKKVSLHTAPQGADGSVAVLISEVRERLGAHSTGVATLSGADVVRLLQADAGILVALSNRAFSIARDRVDWLKKGIEASQARAAAAASGATPPPAPRPAPAAAQPGGFPTISMPAPAPAPAPRPAAPAGPAAPAATELSLEKPAPAPVKRNKAAVLDVAALKPRSVGMPEFGLDFFVPAAWREARSAKVLRFQDEEHGTKLEIQGVNRDGMSLAQWVGMRQKLVEHEMRYLVQDGAPVTLDGEGWRDRVRGMAIEYKGTVPGDTVETRYLLACIWMEGTMVAFGIRASAEVFEDQRALYKWLLGRVELAGGVPALPAGVYAAGAQSGYEAGGDTQDIGMFGVSTEGRMGRLRVLAYSVPTVVPSLLLMALGAFLMPKAGFLGGAMLIGGGVLMVWFTLRLMILRLHDMNISGKWILGFLFVGFMAGVTGKPLLAVATLGLFWIGTLLIYYVLPGNAGDNDYGPPPAPNTTLIKAGAALYCAVQLVMIAGSIKTALSPQNMAGFAMGGTHIPGPNAVGIPFSPPEENFVVDLPGVPEEVPTGMPPNSPVQVQQFQLSQGNREYMVQAIDYGEAPSDRYAAVNDLQKAVIANDGVLLEAKPFMFNNGVIGREVRVNLRNNMVRAGRFALVGSKLCMVMVAAPRGPEAEAHIAAVFKTFQLK